MRLQNIILPFFLATANSTHLRGSNSDEHLNVKNLINDEICNEGPCVFTANRVYEKSSNVNNYIPDCDGKNKYVKDMAIGDGVCDDGRNGTPNLLCYGHGSLRYYNNHITLNDQAAIIKIVAGNDGGDCTFINEEIPNSKSSNLLWMSLIGTSIVFTIIGYVLGKELPKKPVELHTI